MTDILTAVNRTAEQILDDLQSDAIRDFEDLVTAIARGYDGSLGTIMLAEPWGVFTDHVARTLILAGKSFDDLAAAVSERK